MSEITRARWKDDEWQAVCAELYKVLPTECRSSTMIGIKASDMTAAMHKALPKTRWRLSMNMTKIRHQLLEQMPIFLQVHDIMAQREAQRIQDEEQAEKDVERSALAPFAKLLAELMFEHLRPMIDAHLAGRPAINQPVDAVLSHHRVAAPHRKPRIGIIGLLPIQADSMRAQFPLLEIRNVEKGNNGEEVRGLTNMDAIFGLTQKMSHSAENVLRKYPAAWPKYHRVAGKGVTAMKRAVAMWMQDSAQA